MDRDEIIAQLKKKHIVYGSEYTVQCAYLWDKETDLLELENKKPHSWSVCKNEQIDVYDDGTRFELCPMPVETFKANEVEKAADKFIELEYGSDISLGKLTKFAITAGIGLALLLIFLVAITDCLI